MSAEHGQPHDGDAAAAASPEELAREALARAKEAAARRGARPGGGFGSAGRIAPARSRPGDPEPVGAAIHDLLAQRGWQQRITVATLFARWGALVGEQLAQHCRPRSYDEGRLHVTADSTSWATHLRALAPELLRRLTEELGPNVVTEVRITGPTAPSWRHGPRHIRGRGPRDTYG